MKSSKERVRVDLRMEADLKKALLQIARREGQKRKLDLTLTDIATEILRRAVEQDFAFSTDQVLGIRLERAIQAQMGQAMSRLGQLVIRSSVEANATRRAVMVEISARKGEEYSRSLALGTYGAAMEELSKSREELARWLSEYEKQNGGQG